MTRETLFVIVKICTNFLQSRPFGVALLMGGFDGNTPVLFHTDPSGTYLQYSAKAIGSGSEGAQNQLEQEYHKVCIVTSWRK